MKLVEFVGFELTLDEYDVGDGDVFIEVKAEVFGTGNDCCGARVRIDRADSQTMPDGHWRDHRDRA